MPGRAIGKRLHPALFRSRPILRGVQGRAPSTRRDRRQGHWAGLIHVDVSLWRMGLAGSMKRDDRYIPRLLVIATTGDGKRGKIPVER